MEASVKREREVDKLLDSQCYILDLCSTLTRFVTLHEPGTAPLAKCGLIARLAHVYERVRLSSFSCVHLDSISAVGRDLEGFFCVI